MLVWNCSLANSPSTFVHGSTLHQQVRGFFYILFGIISDEIWGMIKTTVSYQLSQYKTLELVVESEPISVSEPISISDNYDLTSIPESSNSVMTEERTHSRAREQQSSRAPVQNVDVDEDNCNILKFKYEILNY
jgi:hypothetical protein